MNYRKEGRGRAWTRQEEMLMKGMFHSGQPYREIAREIGRTPIAVAIKRRKLGLQRRRRVMSEDDLENIRRTALRGMTAKESTIEVGRSSGTIKWYRQKLQVRTGNHLAIDGRTIKRGIPHFAHKS